MNAVQSLVPARFLLLMSHLVFVITLFWSVDETVRACLPANFTADFTSYRVELIVALSITLFLFLLELIGFVSGLSMFNSAQTLFSIAAHASGTVALAFYVFESYYCRFYWYIFSFCSALPAVTEIFAILSVLWLKKSV